MACIMKEFIVIVAALSLAACSSDKKASEKTGKAAASSTAKAAGGFDAATAFKTTCGPCHGETGAGDGAAAATLDPKPASFVDPEFHKTRDRAHITKVIKEGGAAVGKSPIMASFSAQFSDEEIGKLADHVISLKK